MTRVIAMACWLAASFCILPGQGMAVDEAPGANLDALLALAHQLSPDLAAARLEADASAARASAAGALDDPIVRLEAQDIDRRRGGVLPSGRIGARFYRIEQDFPLWGKRDLRRDIAASEALSMRERSRMVAIELAARVKVAFVQHYQAAEALRINATMDGLLRTVSAAAQIRMGQAQESQAGVLEAEAERTRLAIERSDLERDREIAIARLNSLLDRPPGAGMAAPVSLGKAPELANMPLDALISRMEAANPELAAERAGRAAAASERRLADKAWYPDITVGASVVDRGGTVSGYETMLGVRVPLQWGVKEAMQREATAKLGAAEARIRGVAARARGDLAQGWQALRAAGRTERLLEQRLLPQADAAWRSGLLDYEAGRGEFAMLLEAERRVQQARLDLLRARVEQRVLLAELERIVGEQP